MVYRIVNPSGQSPIILVCEHASNFIPPEYKGLGLDQNVLTKHVAYDIGAGKVATKLAEHLDASAVLANFSRLLIDPNRNLNHPQLILTESDGIMIPGNQNVSAKDRDVRIKQYHQSFQSGLRDFIDQRIATGQTPLMLGIHSFTPHMGDETRPWPICIMWNQDKGPSSLLVKALKEQGHNVGENMPYSGKDLFHTMNEHGLRRGLPHALIEIRQDQISNQRGIDKWVEHLASAIKTLIK